MNVFQTNNQAATSITDNNDNNKRIEKKWSGEKQKEQTNSKSMWPRHSLCECVCDQYISLDSKILAEPILRKKLARFSLFKQFLDTRHTDMRMQLYV